MESCLKASDEKAKKALSTHNFGLLAQSVALKDKANSMSTNEIMTQEKLVKEFQGKLVQ